MKPTPDQDDYYTELLRDFSDHIRSIDEGIISWDYYIDDFMYFQMSGDIHLDDGDLNVIEQAVEYVVYDDKCKQFCSSITGKFVKL